MQQGTIVSGLISLENIENLKKPAFQKSELGILPLSWKDGLKAGKIRPKLNTTALVRKLKIKLERSFHSKHDIERTLSGSDPKMNGQNGPKRTLLKVVGPAKVDLY